MERRDFIRQSAGVASWTAVSAGRVLGSTMNGSTSLNRLRRARHLRHSPHSRQRRRTSRRRAPEYRSGNMDPRLKEPRNVDVTALSDCYGLEDMDSAKRWAPQATTYDDFRKLLAAKNVDAVVIATPDHWHAEMTIRPAKPARTSTSRSPCSTAWAAQAMINPFAATANRAGRDAAPRRGSYGGSRPHRTGRQDRRGPLRESVELHGHRLWQAARPGCSSAARPELGRLAGPAPFVAFNRQPARLPELDGLHQRLITDYGNHRFDTVHQIMGEEIPPPPHPPPSGSNKRNAGDLYDMQQATFEYPNYILSYEACNYNGHGLGGRTPGHALLQRPRDGRPPARDGFLRHGGNVFVTASA